MVFPVIEAAAVELGPILARAGVALLGGATVAGTASLSGDTPKEDSKATPDVRALPRTGESCKKCPPDAGTRVRRNHGVNWNSYRYQARITGFPFDIEACRWSEEWRWLGVDFDGFQPGECLLQETKGNYDQFIDTDGRPKRFFAGFFDMSEQILNQSIVVNSNPPARLMWYFATPKARTYMLPTLTSARVQSVYQP
ncbi:restriction endonuclease fold toxin 5 domain-containing protein [Burkholderia savannae]|uniref:restriction endonuclease fold toxin 5 domain-containing protein n=1 Tax=Burkholderia savannae TaxID=1637837 RepID=UPI001CF773BC|nr:restriction endonuclease fold toxin 5 domain-containing protein [Burkholderia savannae]